MSKLVSQIFSLTTAVVVKRRVRSIAKISTNLIETSIEKQVSSNNKIMSSQMYGKISYVITLI